MDAFVSMWLLNACLPSRCGVDHKPVTNIEGRKYCCASETQPCCELQSLSRRHVAVVELLQPVSSTLPRVEQQEMAECCGYVLEIFLKNRKGFINLTTSMTCLKLDLWALITLFRSISRKLWNTSIFRQHNKVGGCCDPACFRLSHPQVAISSPTPSA